MSYLIAELFERHDRSRFEIFGYCNSPEDGSDIRAPVIAAFDHFTIIRTCLTRPPPAPFAPTRSTFSSTSTD